MRNHLFTFLVFKKKKKTQIIDFVGSYLYVVPTYQIVNLKNRYT
jgi:hypothetical protein